MTLLETCKALRLDRIEIRADAYDLDVTYYFDADPTYPYRSREFADGATRARLHEIERLLRAELPLGAGAPQFLDPS